MNSKEEENIERVRVKRVIDGDTVVLEDDRRIRLFGIDAPESTQDFGTQAKEFLQDQINSNPDGIYIIERDVDNYGRVVASLYKSTDQVRRSVNLQEVKQLESNLTDLCLLLVINGYAWVYRKYIKDKVMKQLYINAEDQARVKKSGLWRNPSPKNPSDYRKSRRYKKSKSNYIEDDITNFINNEHNSQICLRNSNNNNNTNNNNNNNTAVDNTQLNVQGSLLPILLLWQQAFGSSRSDDNNNQNTSFRNTDSHMKSSCSGACVLF